jgi:hypothetical protein
MQKGQSSIRLRYDGKQEEFRRRLQTELGVTIGPKDPLWLESAKTLANQSFGAASGS